MRLLRQRFYFVLIAVVVAFFGVTFIGYRFNQYSGDFYSFYVALENWLLRGDLLAFPLYEHVLGVHSYFTLFLIAPLVSLFPSPFLFPTLSLLAWCLGAFLFFEICAELNKRGTSDPASPFWFGCLFLSLPLVVHFAAPLYDPFEPDHLILPLILAMFWSMLVKKRSVFYWAFLLLLLTKEEFIVLAPVYIFLLWFLLTLRRGFLWGEKRDVFALVALLIATAILSGAVLTRYRALNSIGFFIRTGIYPNLLFEKSRLASSIGALARLFGSLVPYLVFICCRVDRRAAIVMGISLLLFPIGRELLAIVTYPESIPFYAHWRIGVAPFLLLTVAVITYYLRDQGRLTPRAMNRWLMSVLVLNVVFGAMLKGSTRDKFLTAFSRRERMERQAEADQILRWVGPRRTPQEVLVLPEALYPWFYRWGDLLPSATLFPWQRRRPRETNRSPFFVLEQIEDRVRFVVLHRNEPEALRIRIAQSLSPVGETTHYLVYTRNAR